MKNLDSVRCGVRYAAVPLTLAALAGCSEGRTRRPNIIVMMTDDHTTQAMSCYGSLLVETPNLDRLAREGVASPEETQAMWDEARAEIAAAVEYGRQSPEPAPDSIFEDVYAD